MLSAVLKLVKNEGYSTHSNKNVVTPLTAMFGKFFVVPTEDKGIFSNSMCHEDLSPRRYVQCYYCHYKKLFIKQNVKGKHSFQLMEFNFKKQQYNETT